MKHLLHEEFIDQIGDLETFDDVKNMIKTLCFVPSLKLDLVSATDFHVFLRSLRLKDGKKCVMEFFENELSIEEHEFTAATELFALQTYQALLDKQSQSCQVNLRFSLGKAKSGGTKLNLPL